MLQISICHCEKTELCVVRSLKGSSDVSPEDMQGLYSKLSIIGPQPNTTPLQARVGWKIGLGIGV